MKPRSDEDFVPKKSISLIKSYDKILLTTTFFIVNLLSP